MPPASMPIFQDEIELRLTQEGTKWKVDDAQLEALLSLVTYSAWAADQIKMRYTGGNPAHREQSRDQRTRRHIPIKNDSIGWLRGEAPDSQTIDIVVGKSSPKLLSDLCWWVHGAQKSLKRVDMVQTYKNNGLPTISTGHRLVFSGPTVKRPAVGFYANFETSESIGMVIVHHLTRKALTCPGEVWSFECIKSHALILHLFSTFVWATTSHPRCLDSRINTEVSGAIKFFEPFITDSFLIGAISPIIRHFPQPQNDQINTLVQELKETGLGTSEEIYRVLIPPLSHFDILPNEYVARWFGECLLNKEDYVGFENQFDLCLELLNTVHHRGLIDRFAKEVGGIVITFLSKIPDWEDHDVDWEKLKEAVKEHLLLKKTLRRGLERYGCSDIQTRLGLYDET